MHLKVKRFKQSATKRTLEFTDVLFYSIYPWLAVYHSLFLAHSQEATAYRRCSSVYHRTNINSQSHLHPSPISHKLTQTYLFIYFWYVGGCQTTLTETCAGTASAMSCWGTNVIEAVPVQWGVA